MAEHDTEKRQCVCKGIRKCIFCEKTQAQNNILHEPLAESISTLSYCCACKKAWQITPVANVCSHSGISVGLSGVEVVSELVTEQEELEIIRAIDGTHWVDSQSGRRKQDYGPKVNFKRKKIKTSVFTGLPPFSKLLVDRMRDLPSLSDFIPVELCNLEYTPERGSAIDPHFDDFWLWGERLVTLNLLSDICYTMTSSTEKYQVLVAVPRRSLLVLQGEARHAWKHSIRREHIQARRVGITLRELTLTFKQGGSESEIGTQLIDTALTYRGISVAEFEALQTSKENGFVDNNLQQHIPKG